MNKKTTTFQENIRNTFISYAIIPSLILVCLAMLLFYWSWNYAYLECGRCGYGFPFAAGVSAMGNIKNDQATAGDTFYLHSE